MNKKLYNSNIMNFQKYPEYSSCTGKKKYDSVIDASDAGKMQMFNNEFKIELYIYQCNWNIILNN